MSQQSITISGAPEPTFKLTGTNDSQSLPTNKTTHPSDSKITPMSALITVEDYAIRYTVGGVEASDVLGHSCKSGDVINLECFKAVKTFAFVNKVSGEVGVLMVSVGF